MGEILDFREAANFLRVKPSTIRAWTSQGRLPIIKLGRRSVRYLRADLEELVRQNRVASKG